MCSVYQSIRSRSIFSSSRAESCRGLVPVLDGPYHSGGLCLYGPFTSFRHELL